MNAGIFAVVIILATFIGLVVWDNVRIDEYQAQCATERGTLIRIGRSSRFICAEIRVLNTEYQEKKS